MKAFLMLQDGTRFYGEAFGDVKNTVGEVVFSTSMSGYQANLCEPSFCGQIAVLTYPIIGDGGFENYDLDPNRVSVKGVVVKELCDSPINWKNRCDIDGFFKKFGIVGIKDIDTRALTIKIREEGVMNGMICIEEPTQEQIDALKAYKIEKPVHYVSTKEVKKYEGNGKKVAVLDYFKKGSPWLHFVGILGGSIWCLGTSLNFAASTVAGVALAWGLGQGATMVSAFWGVFIWKEFKGASAKVNALLALMFLFFIVGLGILMAAK